jgi:hypothetical protein
MAMDTTKKVFRVKRGDIGYLRFTIESYDGMAVVRTLDPFKALIELQISPGCEEFVQELMTSLSKEERLMVEDIGSGI